MLREHIPFFTMKVAGRSMLPTFSPRDTVLVNRTSYLFRAPTTGDVVVLYHPYTKRVLLKRIVAAPGSHLRLDGTIFTVDDVPQKKHMPEAVSQKQRYEWRIPDQCYFVAGDNLYTSTDSRHFGFVQQSHFIGKVVKNFPQNVYV